jgi:hypothetical protein
MNRFALLLLAALLAACANLDYTARVEPGGVMTETVHYRPWGGSEALQTPGGLKYAGNRNSSFKQFMQFMTTLSTEGFAFLTYRIGQLTEQLKDTNLNVTQRAQITADLQKYQAQLKAATKSEYLSTGAANGLFTAVPFPTKG